MLGLFAFAGVLLGGAFARLQPVFAFAGLAFFHAARPFCGPRLFALGFARLRRLGAGAFAGFFGLAFGVTGLGDLLCGVGRAFALGVAASAE